MVADHDRDGAVVWAGEGRDGASGKDSGTLARFYDQLGPDRCAKLQAVSLDLGGAYAKATRTHAPHATQCAEPFHVIALADKAIDETAGGPGTCTASMAPAAAPDGPNAPAGQS